MKIEFIDKSKMGYENKFKIGEKVKITEHTYLRTSLKKHDVYTICSISPVFYPSSNEKAYLYEVLREKTGEICRFHESQIKLKVVKNEK